MYISHKGACQRHHIRVRQLTVPSFWVILSSACPWCCPLVSRVSSHLGSCSATPWQTFCEASCSLRPRLHLDRSHTWVTHTGSLDGASRRWGWPDNPQGKMLAGNWSKGRCHQACHYQRVQHMRRILQLHFVAIQRHRGLIRGTSLHVPPGSFQCCWLTFVTAWI